MGLAHGVGHIENWKEVALVRSQFGTPTTPIDGQTLFRRLRKEMLAETGELMLAFSDPVRPRT